MLKMINSPKRVLANILDRPTVTAFWFLNGNFKEQKLSRRQGPELWDNCVALDNTNLNLTFYSSCRCNKARNAAFYFMKAHKTKNKTMGRRRDERQSCEG